jgi:phage terminase large subunit-like protein
LFPWQLFALEGAFQVDEANTFVHSTNLVSTGRQNGKTTMLSAIVGWCLIELPQIWGRPVRILSTAHELSLATEVFEELREVFELWEESGLAKVTWAYGRNKVVMADGSTYVVKAATGKKHGGTYDILIADELWAISEASYFGALKPSQIAVPSPLAFLTSTAGDESSKVFLRLREAALADIDKRKTGSTYMCEWSLPPGVDPLDQNYWGYANPSLGRTITVRGLQDAAEAPDRSSYLRAHCNQWVAAAGAWINPGVWAGAVTEPTNIEGGVLAVDNSIDEARYVAVRAVNDNGRIVCNVAFVAESSRSMWEQINAAMENDPKLKLAITPGLDLLTPERWAKRRSIWGYAELLKYTGLVRNMITEGILYHTGEQMLAEHVNRAVLVRANGSVVISSQRSPGPIELARCLVAAASMVARPGGGGRAAMGSSR